MILSATQIQEIIPHRYPMLLVDKIIELEPLKRAVGLKCVTMNEEIFQGHFPGEPVFPGNRSNQVARFNRQDMGGGLC